jgi:hypothetical protein
MQLFFYYCGKHLAYTWLDFLAQPRARCTYAGPPSECISLSKTAKCNLSVKKEWRESQWIERHSRHDFRNLVVMFLNLTQHLVEKVMLQNITITTTTTTTATTVWDQQQQRFYIIQRPIQKKSSMYGALHRKFGCGSRRIRNIRWSGGSGDHQM